MRHTKTDPACIHYKETGPFRRYLNERGRGKHCNLCVPLWRNRQRREQHVRGPAPKELF